MTDVLERKSEPEKVRQQRDNDEYGKFYGKILLASAMGLVICILLSIAFPTFFPEAFFAPHTSSWRFVEFLEMIVLLGIPIFFLLSLVLWILSFFISAKIRYRIASSAIFLTAGTFLAVCIWINSLRPSL